MPWNIFIHNVTSAATLQRRSHMNWAFPARFRLGLNSGGCGPARGGWVACREARRPAGEPLGQQAAPSSWQASGYATSPSVRVGPTTGPRAATGGAGNTVTGACRGGGSWG
jgi:hypothetical protein